MGLNALEGAILDCGIFFDLVSSSHQLARAHSKRELFVYVSACFEHDEAFSFCLWRPAGFRGSSANYAQNFAIRNEIPKALLDKVAQS